MIKRWIALTLTLALLSCAGFSSFAETADAPSDDPIGDFLTGAWDRVTTWAKDAWQSASEWLDQAWGEASEWVGRAWNESSEWVMEIWGEASAWASDSYQVVSQWMVETFDQVTESAQNAWQWLKEETATLSEQSRATLERIRQAIEARENDADVKASFYELLEQLGVTGEDADKVWKTIQAYAKEKGISTEDAARLALPYLFQLTVNSETDPSVSASPLAIAQYLTAVFEKMGIQDDAQADELLQQLETVLE